MRCGSCGWDNPAGIIFCTNCGKRLADRSQSGSVPLPTTSGAHPIPAPPPQTQTDSPICARCGAQTVIGLRFCRECGAPLDPGGGHIATATPAQLGHAATAASFAVSSASAATPPVTCWRCHEPRDVLSAFCRHCGAPATETSAATPQPMERSAPALPSAQARLVTLLKDGSEGRSIPLTDKDADIGASEGDIVFPDDPYLSPRHARIVCRGGAYTLRDLDSVNGVYVRVREAVELRDRDMVLLGQQVLRFELLSDGELPLGPAFQRGVLVFGTPEVARFARLVQYTTEGIGRDLHYLFRDETVIGRENGDIVFTEDPFLSRRHAAIRVDHASRSFSLHDLGSSNGTAIRMRGEHVLRDGDQFRIGRHLFRFEAGSTGGRGGR